MNQTTHPGGSPSRVKLRANQVAGAGEHYVAAEICRRGGYAVTFSGNMPGIDVLASGVPVAPRPIGSRQGLRHPSDTHRRNTRWYQLPRWVRSC